MKITRNSNQSAFTPAAIQSLISTVQDRRRWLNTCLTSTLIVQTDKSLQ